MGTSASSPVSANHCRQPKVSKPILDFEWEGPWKIVSVPESEIESDTSAWNREIPCPEVRIAGKYHGNYEVVIDPVDILALKYKGCQMNLEYNPVEPAEGQKAVQGINYANQKARNQWLRHATDVVCSAQDLEVQQAFYELARRCGIRGKLVRAILERDIEAPPAETLSPHEPGYTLRAIDTDSNVQYKGDDSLQFDANQYILARLSNIGPEDVTEIFPERMTPLPNIVELNDGSWEIVVLKEKAMRLQEVLKNIAPISEVDLNYNPLEATEEDLQEWGDATARTLRERSFRQRAQKMVEDGGLEEAAYYNHLLAVMDSKRAAA